MLYISIMKIPLFKSLSGRFTILLAILLIAVAASCKKQTDADNNMVVSADKQADTDEILQAITYFGDKTDELFGRLKASEKNRLEQAEFIAKETKNDELKKLVTDTREAAYSSKDMVDYAIISRHDSLTDQIMLLLSREVTIEDEDDNFSPVQEAYIIFKNSYDSILTYKVNHDRLAEEHNKLIKENKKMLQKAGFTDIHRRPVYTIYSEY